VKCFSYKQPWANLVLWQDKAIETRSVNYTVLAGRWHAIHASNTWKRDQQALFDVEPFQTVLANHGVTKMNAVQATLPRGAIIGVAFCGWIRPTIDVSVSNQERAFGDYAKGRWAFGITKVFPLMQPILYTGRLGVWDLPAAVERQVLVGLQFHDDIPDDLTSDDLLNEAVAQAEAARIQRQEFDAVVKRLHGRKLDTRTPIERMIDKAVGLG
jgi:hypothetical protein